MTKLTAPPSTAEWVENISHLGGGAQIYFTVKCPPSIAEYAIERDENYCEEHRRCLNCSAGVAWQFLSVLRDNRLAMAPVDVFAETAKRSGAADVDLFVEDFGEMFAIILDAIEEADDE